MLVVFAPLVWMVVKWLCEKFLKHDLFIYVCYLLPQKEI